MNLSIRKLIGKKLSWARHCRFYSQGKYGEENGEDLRLAELDKKYEEVARNKLENLNDDLKRRRKRIESEIEQNRLQGFKMPKTITAVDMLQLVIIPSNAKRRLMRFQRLAEKEELQRKLDEEQRQKSTTVPECEHVAVRGIDEADSELGILDQYAYASHRSLSLGMPLIFDLDYNITILEQRNTCIRLLQCYMQNMAHFNPYHLIFSGYETTYFGQAVDMYNLDQRLHASFTKDVFAEPYNKEDYVYLSPAGEWLDDYEPDKTYIIGAYTDILGQGDLTLSRAKQLGIQIKQFPLMSYRRWKQDLGLNTVMDIMLDVSLCASWEQALHQSLIHKDRPSSVTDRDGSLTAEKWQLGKEKQRKIANAKLKSAIEREEELHSQEIMDVRPCGQKMTTIYDCLHRGVV